MMRTGTSSNDWCLALVALGGAAAAAIWLPLPQALYGALLACAVARIAAADLAERIVPHADVIAVFVGGLAVRVADDGARTTFLDNSDVWSRLGDAGLAALALAATLTAIAWAFRSVTGRDGLGTGDVYLLAAWCSWLPLLSVIDAMTLAALVSIAAIVILRRFDENALADGRFPFAATLAPALWLVWLFAERARLA